MEWESSRHFSFSFGGNFHIQKFETNERRMFCLQLFFIIEESLKMIQTKIFGTKNKKEDDRLANWIEISDFEGVEFRDVCRKGCLFW